MAKSFDEFIREQRGQSTSSRDRQDRLAEWKSSIQNLFSLIRSLLKQYVDRGDVQTTITSMRISEDIFGAYEVDSMVLTMGTRQVRLLPVGANVLGANGRVDLEGPRGTVKLVLVPKELDRARIRITRSSDAPPPQRSAVDWTWKIATSPPGLKLIELNEKSLQDAILEVADI